MWLMRPEPGVYLAEALRASMDSGLTFRFYALFLDGIVLPNVGLFAVLVGVGELLSGFSFVLGLAHRLSAVVICFQFLNYGLLSGFTSLISHAVMMALVGVTVYWGSARTWGVDRWLHARWPNAHFW